jgi:eukaryotic-like serine/threonine-protein kinase
MAPERFRGVSDRRCDIYALGATLYELLTLRQAFDAKDQLQLIHQIENDPPVPPRQLERGIPRDLETIVLKALAKNPADRFETADHMAAELRRFIENRPIRSRPIPFYQRLGRWCKRNPKLAAVSITAAALTMVLAIVSTIFAWNYREQRNEIRTSLIKISASESVARQARTEARQELFKALLDRARAGRLSRRMGQRFESLDALSQAAAIARELKLPPERFDPLRDEAIACMALPDLRPTGRAIAHPPHFIAWTFDSKMTRYALRFPDGTIQVRRVADDTEVARFQARRNRDFWVFCLSPDGRYLSTVHGPGSSLTVWDIERRAVTLDDPGPVWGSAAKFNPDSRRIAVSHDASEVLVYDLPTGQRSQRWRIPGAGALAFNPDGTQIAVLSSATKIRSCRILQADTGRLDRSIPLPPTFPFTGLAWSPDGATLATPCDDSRIYLWDVATGTRKWTLDGHTNNGLRAAFHPAGTLLASNGYEGRLRLWDPVLGKPVFTLSGDSAWNEFSHDGRIVVSQEGQLTTYKVDPAVEYRTLAHAASTPLNYARVSIHRGGRIMALGTDGGVVLWDLVRSTEFAFLPIGNAWHLTFEPSGDLLTSGSMGVCRWPVQVGTEPNDFRIGPPRRLPLPASVCGISQDQSGQIVALANHAQVCVIAPGRSFQLGPLDDCRYVAVSPDGEWLATGSHSVGGARVWRIRDAVEVAKLPIDGGTAVIFSPDEKLLMTTMAPCQLWTVGTWSEALQIPGAGLCFSPDGRLVVVQDAGRALRLVETETGRALARLESPDLHATGSAAFSPDGSRLVFSTNEGPAVHVWDLRAIRRNLAEIGLDWDAPAYPETDAVSDNAPPPPLKVFVDMGTLSAELGPLLEHAIRLQDTGKIGEAIGVLRQAVHVSPDLAETHNNLAWLLATAPDPLRDPSKALEHARHAVRLAPGEPLYLNTLGVVLYRAGMFAEALPTLEKSLAAGNGQTAAFDLFFLAMDHQRLGHRQEASASFDRAVSWLRDHPSLPAPFAAELAAFRAEAEKLLAVPRAPLPADVFAPE